MASRIRVTTNFNCTHTGITGHFKSAALPFTDRSGSVITDKSQWEVARNFERNRETVLQIVSLYTQPQDISNTVIVDGQWQFEFSIDADGVFQLDDDPVGLLKTAVEGVPIFVDERIEYMRSNINITFKIINNTL